MNKNITFLAVFGLVSLTALATETELISEINHVAAEAVETVANVEATVEAVEQVAQTVQADVAAVEAAFTPMRFTLAFTVTPGADESVADFEAMTATAKELIEAGRKGSPSVYQNILVFIKEVQEAIVAGMNLFAVASTSQESLTALVEEVALEAAQDVIKNETEQINAQDLPSKGIVEDTTNNILVAYSVVVDKIEKLAAWESIKAQMIAVAEAVNLRTKSSAEITSMLGNILEDAQELENSVLTLSASTTSAQ